MSSLEPSDPRYRRRLKAAQRYAEDNPHSVEASRAVLRLMLGANRRTQEGIRQFLRDTKHWNATHPDEQFDPGEAEMLDWLEYLVQSERGMVALLSGNEG